MTRIRELGIIPSIRTALPDDAEFAAEVLTTAGIPLVEITMTIPGAVDVVRRLVRGRRA